MMIHALSINVYRDADNVDCTNNGISSRYSRLLVLCEDGNITIPEDKVPGNLVRVVKRTFAGKAIYHLEPVSEPDGIGWMMGGNYAASSDARFSRLVDGMYGAIAVHDRQESYEMYDALSH